MIIILLEKACALQHWLVDRWDPVAWLWYERLDLPHCALAYWSSRLDEKWGTGVWTDA